MIRAHGRERIIMPNELYLPSGSLYRYALYSRHADADAGHVS